MSQAQTLTADTATKTDAIQTLDSPNSKLIYLYLGTRGASSAGEICDDLGLPHMTTYSLLDTLVGRGLVSKRENDYAVAAK